MKAYNKIEKEVENLNVPSLTKDIVKKAKRRCFRNEKMNIFARKKNVQCPCCGSLIDVKYDADKTIQHLRCPHCHNVMENIKMNTKRKSHYYNYFDVFEEYKGYQLCRRFRIDVFCEYGKENTYTIKEMYRHWFNSMGEHAILGHKKYMFSMYFDDSFNYNTPLTIKRPTYNQYGTYSYEEYTKVVFIKSIIPELKKRGFKTFDYDFSYVYLIRNLFSDNINETLIKTGHYNFLNFSEYRINNYRDQIMLAIRHNYHMSYEDTTMWFDMINNLKNLGKDIHNPVYICPKNLHQEHDRWQHLYENKMEKERKKNQSKIYFEQIERDKKDIKKFNEEKKRFFNIVITIDDIVIKPLTSIKEFAIEGKLMRNCVFTNRYYSMKDSLILSARRGEKHIATIEYNLKTNEVVQCRKVCNGVPEERSIIVAAIEANKKLFQNASRVK